MPPLHITPPLALEATLADLLRRREELHKVRDDIARQLKEIQDAIDDIVQPIAEQALDDANITSGTRTIAFGPFKLVAEIKKTVTWDTDKLMSVAAKMPWEKVQRIFNLKMTVPEKIYMAMTDDELRAEIEKARTVKFSECAARVTFAEPSEMSEAN